MLRTIQERYVIKFCVGLRKSGTQTLVFWTRLGNKASKLRMARCGITSSKKGSYEQIRSERHASRCQRGASQRICTWGRQLMEECWKEWSTSHTCSKVNEYIPQPPKSRLSLSSTFFYSQMWNSSSKNTTMRPQVASTKLARLSFRTSGFCLPESWKRRWQKCVDVLWRILMFYCNIWNKSIFRNFFQNFLYKPCISLQIWSIY